MKPRVNGLIYGGAGNAGMGGWVPPQNLEKKTYKTIVGLFSDEIADMPNRRIPGDSIFSETLKHGFVCKLL